MGKNSKLHDFYTNARNMNDMVYTHFAGKRASII